MTLDRLVRVCSPRYAMTDEAGSGDAMRDRNLLHRALAGTAALMPAAILRRIAAPYLAGPTAEDALAEARRLAADGCHATIDLLGEGVVSDGTADATVLAYRRVLQMLALAGLSAGISVKPTALGLMSSGIRAEARLCAILDKALEAGRFVRIDMEESTTTDATLRLYESVRDKGYTNVGVVLQACLRRSLTDARRLVDAGIADVRVCKGIYVESSEIAYKHAGEVRAAYVRVSKALLEGGGRVAFATHDDLLVDACLGLVHSKIPAKERHEFQVLLGVREDVRRRLLEAGERVRVYLPYGADSVRYARRRVRENPALARHVARSLFRMRHSG
jgi:proline dehydrogenase